MRSRLLLALVVICVAAGLLGWSHWAHAAGDMPTPTVTAEANPVVSSIAGYVETTFEQDPFDQTKVRRSLMRVKSVIVVHADGTVETKPAP